ncbi:ADP-ribosylation factor-like protein 13B [Cariama cristata]
MALGGYRRKMLRLMASCCSRSEQRQDPVRKVTLLMVGLENAGKTSIVQGIQGESPEDVIPTVGFSKLDFQQGCSEVTIFDLGGGKQIRGIWGSYYADAHGVIFVVDSSDVARMEETKRALADVLSSPKISGKPVLVLANKQDREGALPEADLIETLDLEKLVNKHKCPCKVQPCSTIMACRKIFDKDINEGLNWLLYKIAEDFDALNDRVERDTAKQRALEERKRLERAERICFRERSLKAPFLHGMSVAIDLFQMENQRERECPLASSQFCVRPPSFASLHPPPPNPKTTQPTPPQREKKEGRRLRDEEDPEAGLSENPFRPIAAVIAEREKQMEKEMKQQSLETEEATNVLRSQTAHDEIAAQNSPSSSTPNTTGSHLGTDNMKKKKNKLRLRRCHRVAPLNTDDGAPQNATAPPAVPPEACGEEESRKKSRMKRYWSMLLVQMTEVGRSLLIVSKRRFG